MAACSLAAPGTGMCLGNSGESGGRVPAQGGTPPPGRTSAFRATWDAELPTTSNLTFRVYGYAYHRYMWWGKSLNTTAHGAYGISV